MNLRPWTNNKHPRSEALETFSNGTRSTASARGGVLRAVHAECQRMLNIPHGWW